MLIPETLKASPAENYEDLKRQFFALRKLCESKIKQCSIYSKKLAEYDRESVIARNEALNSEREMNAQLTAELEKVEQRCEELEYYNVRLANESHEYQQRCAELERDIKNKELIHVGFTNGDQVKCAKVEEGAFYPDTSGNCYIPLYMLKSHEHRIETTSIEQIRKGGES